MACPDDGAGITVDCDQPNMAKRPVVARFVRTLVRDGFAKRPRARDFEAETSFVEFVHARRGRDP